MKTSEIRKYDTVCPVATKEIGDVCTHMSCRVPGPCTIAKGLGTNLARETPRG